MNTVYADSLGFFAPPGIVPVFGHNRPGVSLAHLTSVPPLPDFMAFDKALTAHYRFRQQALSNPGTYEVLTPADLDSGSFGIIFGMQHMPSAMTFDRMRLFYDVGVRVMALVYQGSTEYGNGFAVPLGGLTHRGREVIRVMADVGMILDLSHANQRTAGDALDFISSKNIRLNVMASHSGASSVFPHPRNLTDYLMKGVVGLKGYIGIPAVTFMLTEKRLDGLYIESFVLHIEHAVTVCGMSSVGIGSDCLHANQTLQEAEMQYERMSKMLGSRIFGAYFPDRPIHAILHGRDLFDVFESHLRRFQPEQREGILGKNFIHFLERSLSQA